jgi:hypothetical protein
VNCVDLSDAISTARPHIPRPIAATLNNEPWCAWTDGHAIIAARGNGGSAFDLRQVGAELQQALDGNAAGRFDAFAALALAEKTIVESGKPCTLCESAGKRNRWCSDCDNSHEQPCCRCSGSGKMPTQALMRIAGRTFDSRIVHRLLAGIINAGGCTRVERTDLHDHPDAPMFLRAADGSWVAIVMPVRVREKEATPAPELHCASGGEL